MGDCKANGVLYGSELSDDAAVIVSEPAANAVLHGRVAGRDFELRLVALAGTLRIEVSDARGERGPEPQPPRSGAESGYGLHLVGVPATSWGVKGRIVGKTVWAELLAGHH
ncbi:ATP-binding protein [Streptomyces sp. NPDC058092]|uniref:ATP-binding protein n=1 Tax=Streptomyces sp. NPDC058092 TaxID=3346336 RepID=UPI0036F0C0E8